MFYQSIAKVYDYIFPKNRKQLEFIEKISKIKENEKILDIGCATGNLSSLLAERTKNITGIDLDRGLLNEAKNKNLNIEFIELNMLQIDKKFKENSFDKIVSFGNTIVHLDSVGEVEEFFYKVYGLLKKEGYFMVQIINYDRIIEKDIKNLSTVDNQKIKFVRDYTLTDNNKKVEFITELTIKKNHEIIKNSVVLLALRKNNIKDILEKIGFINIEFYGNFMGEELKENSEPLIFVAKK